MLRLQKFLAEAGIASRRGSEQVILDGRVRVNGRPVSELGTRVDPARDRVEVDGQPIRARRKQYIALHKPRGYVCSQKDPRNRRVVGDLLPREWGGLYPVGRLDYDSEGLLFLSNDGDFCLHLTHPRYGVRKWYRVVAEGLVEPAHLGRLKRGIVHDGEKLKAADARILNSNRTRSVLELQLVEGKNREVRRMFESLGFNVIELLRTQIGPIRLGNLPSGKWRTLNPPEVRSLMSGRTGPAARSKEH